MNDFIIMKRNIFLVIGLFLMFCVDVNAQNNYGCYEDGQVKYCVYEKACFRNLRKDENEFLKGFEVDYNKIDNVYEIYFGQYKNTLVVRYRSRIGNKYCYKGIERFSGNPITLMCENKLSLYTKNYGVKSKNAMVEGYNKEQILFYFDGQLTAYSIIPIMNKKSKN